MPTLSAYQVMETLYGVRTRSETKSVVVSQGNTSGYTLIAVRNANRVVINIQNTSTENSAFLQIGGPKPPQPGSYEGFLIEPGGQYYTNLREEFDVPTNNFWACGFGDDVLLVILEAIIAPDDFDYRV